jgi:hypothetical protein
MTPRSPKPGGSASPGRAAALSVDPAPGAATAIAPPRAPAPSSTSLSASSSSAVQLPLTGPGWAVFACAFLSLSAGGAYAFLTNVLFATPCDAGCDGGGPDADTTFRKPWLATTAVVGVQAVVSLAVAGLLEVWERCGPRRGSAAGSDHHLDGDGAGSVGSANKETITLTGDADSEPTANESSPQPAASFPPPPTLPSPSARRLLPPARAYETSVFERSMRVPILIVSALDVATVGLQAVASLFLPAAINSAMRGTLLLVTAALGRLLHVFDGGAGRVEWAGICVSTLGALGVGAVHVAAAAFPTLAAPIGGPSAGTARPSTSGVSVTSPANAALGLLLSLASNVTLGLSITYESRVFEKRRPGVLPMNAARTAIGTLVMLAVLALADAVPGRDHGAGENGAHTLCCLRASPPLAGFAAGIGVCATISGNAALFLSKLAGSNFRALIYVGRAIMVWALELATYYAGGAAGDPAAHDYGSGWSVFSYPQAAGFALVAAGGALTWRGRSARQAAAVAAAAAAASEAADRRRRDRGESSGSVGGGGDEAADDGGGGDRGAGSRA